MATLLWWIFLFNKWFPKFLYSQAEKTTSLRELNKKQYEEIQSILWSDYENVFLQINGIRGLINEVHLYFHWGFDMSDFPKNTPIILWHGTNDVIVPWSIMHKLTHHIRLRSTVLYPGGHLVFLTRMREVILRMKQAYDEMDIPSAFSVTPLVFIAQKIPLSTSSQHPRGLIGRARYGRQRVRHR